MLTRCCCILSGSIVLVTAELHAQTDYVTRDCPGTHPVAGIIRGVVLNDSSGASAGRVSVRLEGPSCFAITDTLGRFAFRNVPVGTHSVAVGSLSYRRMRPLPVTVVADSVVDVAIRLRPQNAVADCLEDPSCARFLVTDSTHVSELGPEEQIREIAFRVTIAINRGYRGAWPVLCISDSSHTVIEALHRRFPAAVNGSECETLRDPMERSNVVHRQSRAKGARVSVSRIRVAGEQATAQTYWYVGPLHATGWTCSFTKEGRRWQSQWCRLDVIS